MSGRLFNRDAVTERFELADGAAHRAVAVAASEVVGSEFLIRHTVAHDVVPDLENLMTDCHHGFLVPAVRLDAAVAGLEGRAGGARRRQAALDERSAQKPI